MAHLGIECLALVLLGEVPLGIYRSSYGLYSYGLGEVPLGIYRRGP